MKPILKFVLLSLFLGFVATALSLLAKQNITNFGWPVWFYKVPKWNALSMDGNFLWDFGFSLSNILCYRFVYNVLWWFLVFLSGIVGSFLFIKRHDLKFVGLSLLGFCIFLIGIGCAYYTRTDTGISLSSDEVEYKRSLIEEQYTQYKDFENQDSFAGNTVTHMKKNGVYYFGYIINGSGVPMISATCFMIDENDKVTYIGYAGGTGDGSLTDINLETCTPQNSALNSLDWELPFRTKTVSLDRMGSGKIDGTFWQREIINIPQDSAAPLTDLIQAETWQKEWTDYIYYDESNDRYYVLDNNGFMQIRIVQDEDMDHMVSDKETITQGTQTIERTCIFNTLDFYPNTPWRAMACTYTSISPDGTESVEHGTAINCYINIEGTDDYIAFERGLVGIGEGYDLVTSISQMGIQGAAYAE